MTKNNRPYDSSGLMISYKQLGTINIDELAHAVIEDIQALKDTYNVRYVTGARASSFSPPMNMAGVSKCTDQQAVLSAIWTRITIGPRARTTIFKGAR